MDISATGLSRPEGRRRRVQSYELLIIAKALEVPAEQLLNNGI